MLFSFYLFRFQQNLQIAARQWNIEETLWINEKSELTIKFYYSSNLCITHLIIFPYLFLDSFHLFTGYNIYDSNRFLVLSCNESITHKMKEELETQEKKYS